jgi:AdoMet-dependent heme synthase
MLQASKIPLQPLCRLDTLWIQVAGTLCNLACEHCFVSAGPAERRHGLMSRDEVRGHVADAAALGVREFYFTGGEPFLHPELLPILADTLAVGPCTVLTNGLLFTPARLAALRELREGARVAFELRVSLDGADAAAHDALRGPGTFARALEGLRALAAHGFLPIVAITHAVDEPPGEVVTRAAAMLRAAGLERPRVKLLPMLRLGRETRRSGAPGGDETLAGWDLDAEALGGLQCATGRAVSTEGVYVCPLLVDEPGARMGARLADARGEYSLAHGACHACHVTGLTCANG